MDEEVKNLLKENLEISKKNLKILEEINRARKIGFILKTVYWTVIILVGIAAYYYVQPYFASLNQFLEILRNLPNFKFGM